MFVSPPSIASAKGARKAGRIDIFIPIVKWGIEITRDGSRLLEHAQNSCDKISLTFGCSLVLIHVGIAHKPPGRVR